MLHAVPCTTTNLSKLTRPQACAARGVIDDLAMMVLVVLSIGLGVLVVGAPIALLVRLLIEIAQRL